jgi:hypothetical protein
MTSPFADPPYADVIVPSTDLQTNFSASAEVGWGNVAYDLNGSWKPEAEQALRSVTKLVKWPSLVPVKGEWVTRPANDTLPPRLAFERAEQPTRGWEAVILDVPSLPDEFRTGEVDPSPRGMRLAALSMPIVNVSSARVIKEDDDGEATGYSPKFAGNYFVGLGFSEAVDTVSTVHGFIRLSAGGAELECEPYVPIVPQDIPTPQAVFQCPPIAADATITFTIDGDLASPSGATIAESYGEPAGGDVVLKLTYVGNADVRQIPLEVLADAAHVPGVETIE